MTKARWLLKVLCTIVFEFGYGGMSPVRECFHIRGCRR